MALLAALTVFSVVFFRSQFLINWDAGQLALGTARYSLEDHQPHPPGYFLFVQAGSYLTHFTKDVNVSFQIIAVCATLAAVFLLYWCALRLTARRASAFYVSLFFLANPIAWYYRSVGLTYVFEALAISLSLACTLAVRRFPFIFVVQCAGLAIVAGFRPSSIVASLPLLCLQLWFLRKRPSVILLGVGTGMLLGLAWFIPFVQQVGGFSHLMSLVSSQASAVYSARLLGPGSQELFFKSLLLSGNALLLLVLFSAKHVRNNRITLIVPILFVAFFYLFFHFGETGYILSLLPPLLLLCVPAVDRGVKTRRGKIVLAGILSLQLFLFFSPWPLFREAKISAVTYPSIRAHDERIFQYLQSVRSFQPTAVLVISVRGQHVSAQGATELYASEDIRVLSYYLPAYTLYDVLGVPHYFGKSVNFQSSFFSQESASFPKTTTSLILLADYIHPDEHPKEIRLTHHVSTPALASYYSADLSTVSSFVFRGISFTREASMRTTQE